MKTQPSMLFRLNNFCVLVVVLSCFSSAYGQQSDDNIPKQFIYQFKAEWESNYLKLPFADEDFIGIDENRTNSRDIFKAFNTSEFLVHPKYQYGYDSTLKAVDYSSFIHFETNEQRYKPNEVYYFNAETLPYYKIPQGIPVNVSDPKKIKALYIEVNRGLYEKTTAQIDPIGTLVRQFPNLEYVEIGRVDYYIPNEKNVDYLLDLLLKEPNVQQARFLVFNRLSASALLQIHSNFHQLEGLWINHEVIAPEELLTPEDFLTQAPLRFLRLNYTGTITGNEIKRLSGLEVFIGQFSQGYVPDTTFATQEWLYDLNQYLPKIKILITDLNWPENPLTIADLPQLASLHLNVNRAKITLTFQDLPKLQQLGLGGDNTVVLKTLPALRRFSTYGDDVSLLLSGKHPNLSYLSIEGYNTTSFELDGTLPEDLELWVRYSGSIHMPPARKWAHLSHSVMKN